MTKLITIFNWSTNCGIRRWMPDCGIRRQDSPVSDNKNTIAIWQVAIKDGEGGVPGLDGGCPRHCDPPPSLFLRACLTDNPWRCCTVPPDPWRSAAPRLDCTRFKYIGTPMMRWCPGLWPELCVPLRLRYVLLTATSPLLTVTCENNN